MDDPRVISESRSHSGVNGGPVLGLGGFWVLGRVVQVVLRWLVWVKREEKAQFGAKSGDRLLSFDFLHLKEL